MTKINITAFPGPAVCTTDTRPGVIALHCSGGSGRQWRYLAQALGQQFNLIAPDLIGCGETPHWSGEHAFRLTDEARRIVAIMDAFRRPVHLVGHSYGGGVALRAARERPYRVESLSLYEPTPFHVLKCLGPGGERALAEIRAVADGIIAGVAASAYQSTARRFVDYWNGTGSYAALKPAMRADLVRYIPEGQPRLPCAAR